MIMMMLISQIGIVRQIDIKNVCVRAKKYVYLEKCEAIGEKSL